MTAIYVAATLILTAISVFFWATGFSTRHSSLTHFVFFDPVAIGGDIMMFAGHYSDWRQMGALVLQQPEKGCYFNYFPLTFFVIQFFTNLPNPPVALALFVCAIALLFAAFLAKAVSGDRLARVALLVAVCTSYPFGFLFDRGNVEGALWIPTAAGIWFFCTKRYTAAALMFGLATCFKPYPAVLFLLLIDRRLYRECLIGAAAAVAVCLGSLAILGPTISTAASEILRGFKICTDLSILPYMSPGNTHTVFALVKVAIRALSGWPHPEMISAKVHTAYPYYVLFSGLVFLVSVCRLRGMPLLNQVFGLCILTTLLPPVNFDYTLVTLYIPWAMLLAGLSRPDCRLPFWPSAWMMMLSAVMFTSQYYILFGETTSGSGLIKTPALAAMLLISVLCPLKSPIYDGYEETNESDQARPLAMSSGSF